MPTEASTRRPIARLALFLVCAILIFPLLSTLYSFAQTLHQLDVVEADRDQWQRPLDVLEALDLKEGSTVVDLGSGAGYFTLKLSSTVGKRGRVLAVDLRRLSLFFLWTRALLAGAYNVGVQVGGEDDPGLPTGAVDAALICNTYHEFTNPPRMLDHVFRSLRPGGQLVVVDRSPSAFEAEHDHAISSAMVESELRQGGFEIIRRHDRFIERPGGDLWWLIIARNPSPAKLLDIR